MDEFYTGLVESLEKAREKKERLLRELEVTDFLIRAQEQALSLYSGNGQSVNGTKTRARRGDKTDLILKVIIDDPFGITLDEIYEQVKAHDIDRAYVSKVLFRMTRAERIRRQGERYYPVVVANGGENPVV